MWLVYYVVLGVVVVVVVGLGWDQWSRSTIVGKSVVAGVGGAVRTMFPRPCELRWSLYWGGDLGITVLGEGLWFGPTYGWCVWCSGLVEVRGAMCSLGM